jgi:Protein of unknown function (DUF2877).
MQFHASSIGSAVPQHDFDAVVQSVFDSSVNLRIKDQDRLITILISDHYELPQGIRLDGKDIPFQSLTVGSRATCSGRMLRFDSSPLTIDLRNAPIWESKLSPIATKPSTKQAISIVLKALNRAQKLKQTDLIADDLFKSDKGSSLTRKFSQPVIALIAATKRFDIEGSTDGAQKMIGLGPGVTPTGDDILIGFLAGLWSVAGEDNQRLLFISDFGKALLSLAKETNEISRTYLYHAVRGEFSSSFITLIKAIGESEEERLTRAAKNAMQVGHSSGMDSITGLVIGLTIWSDPPSPLVSRLLSK